MAWAAGAGRAPPPSPSPPPPPSHSPSPPPPPAAFLHGAGQPSQRLRVGSPHKAKHALRVAVVLLDGRRLEVTCDARVSTVDDVLECVVGSAALQGRPVALASSLCGELVFPPPTLKLARLARLAPATWAPGAPVPAPAPARRSRAPPALGLTLLVRVWLLLPALPALSDACGRRLLFLELRRRAAEGRLRGTRAQLRALGSLARRADALREAHAHAAPSEAEGARRAPSEAEAQAEAGAEAEARRAEDAFVAAAARLPLAGAHVLDAVWVQSSAGSGPRPVALAVAADALSVLDASSAGAGPSAGAPRELELLRLPWPCVRSLRHSARAFRVAAFPQGPSHARATRLRKLKFYLPHKKSMFLFYLASIHHQMYLKLQNHLTTILPSLELEVMNYAQESMENRSNNNKRMHLYEENSCKENNMFHKIATLSSELTSENCRVDHESEDPGSPFTQEAFVLRSSAISSNEKFNVLQETLTESLIEKFEEISFVDERLLCTVRIERDVGGSLGLQVECGNDGGVYVRCCLQHSNKIQKGDRIIAVDGQSLMHLKFTEALNFLKSAGHTVELILSRQSIPNNQNLSTFKISSPPPSFGQRETVSPLRELQTHSPLKE